MPFFDYPERLWLGNIPYWFSYDDIMQELFVHKIKPLKLSYKPKDTTADRAFNHACVIA